MVPQLAPNDTLSGGTVGVLSCGWTVVTGYANGQPRYPESDSTVLSNVPAKDGDVVHFWKGESFQKMRFELELPDSKAAINPSSLRASQEGGHWWIKGPLSSLTPSFTSMSFAQDTQEAASLITPMFSANSGRPTTVVYYEGEALDPYTVLYISPQGAMYRFDVRSPERGYARIR
ncbi:MAG: hypothetical protein A3H72_03865 [Candidatus Doudnabacteria bacterium RIFCSPLOWO2_02_FULL_48_8]|nr:MAG: hypothetical protein A3H72_03865 [Candidatus Doudnabacteria bacterium RIFCSPLOWO2_02_FULL_48_8]